MDEWISLGLQVSNCYLLWALKYINMTYFGQFGAPGFRMLHAGGSSLLDLGLEDSDVPSFWCKTTAGLISAPLGPYCRACRPPQQPHDRLFRLCPALIQALRPYLEA